jgi:hypothetical protein
MIFPDVRISDLRRDVDSRSLAFDRSKDALTRALRKKFSLINLLKDHPQLWMGTAMSLFSIGKVGKVLGLIGLKNGHINGKKAGILGKIFRFGGRTAVRTVMPLAFSALKSVVKIALKSIRSRP